MTDPARLTDRARLDRARTRARLDAADFLHREGAAEIEERLRDVNRTFTAPAVVTGFPDFWAAAHPEARIVADTGTLDLAPGRHDLILHVMALHWADDLVGQLIQSRRALAPDGLFLGVMLGGETLSELRAALGQAEAEIRQGLSPRVAPMVEIRDAGALLQRAGFALPVVDAVRRVASYRDMFHLIDDLRAMGEVNALASRDRRVPPKSLFARAADLYQQAFGKTPHTVPATFELLFLTGWAPAPDQPQPLRRGSATHRLAQALGTTEFDGTETPVQEGET